MSIASPSTENPDDAALYAAQIRLLYEQAPAALIATTVNSVILAVVLWNRISRFYLLGWLLACMFLVLARVYQRRAYLRSYPNLEPAQRWGRRYLMGVTANGILWGLAGFFFFDESSYVHQVLLAFVLAGMSSGSIATLSPVRNAYLAFLIPALLPYLGRLIGANTEVHWAMSGMLVLYAGMMAIVSRRQHRNVVDSLRLRFENLGLVQVLEAEVAQKCRAQDALEKAYDELELRVRERTEELAQSEEALRKNDRIPLANGRISLPAQQIGRFGSSPEAVRLGTPRPDPD